MASIGICTDTSEAVKLFEPQGLYLKPIAKLNICVQLKQMKSIGKSISNWEVMEKLKRMVRPESFISLKVSKSSLEFVRFEGEIENRSRLKTLISLLDSKLIKLSGFPEPLKVRAAEAKVSGPSRHDWESFFRDTKHMNELKRGERPDTVYIKDLPCRWFNNKKEKGQDLPNEFLVRKVFETFGEIACIDIPINDPYRKEMASTKSSAQTFSFGQDILFDVYILYPEYIAFVKAMTALRGMKLMYKADDGKAYTANIKVDFDRTMHLSDRSIRKRKNEREKLIQLEMEREERVRKEREEEQRKIDEEKRRAKQQQMERERRRQARLHRKQNRRQVREEKRRQLQLQKRRLEEEREMERRIALEERKILLAQRKLESIRLLSELFRRVKSIKRQEELERQERELQQARRRQLEMEKLRRLEEERRKLDAERKKHERLEKQERVLRQRILQNLKVMEERKSEKQREELRKKIAGKSKLKSAVVMKRKS